MFGMYWSCSNPHASFVEVSNNELCKEITLTVPLSIIHTAIATKEIQK